MPTKKRKKPGVLTKIAIRETSKTYSKCRPDFLGSREAALDKMQLEPYSTTKNEVRSEISRNGAHRSNAVQRKKRRIKFINDHHGNLFPPAA